MELWGGRFRKNLDQLMAEFNSSFSFDRELYHYDILGSKAHVKMLAKCNIITEGEKDDIIEGLTEIEGELREGKIENEGGKRWEDIHTYVEMRLQEKIGSAGEKLHTARSRNDQVALDMRLYLRDSVNSLCEQILFLLVKLLQMADEFCFTIMPGYTHLQRAQPVTLGHHLLAYYFKFKRDYERLTDNLKRINVMPLGSGALAGTSFPIDRQFVAEELGFDSLSKNSLDGVSDRDYLLEFLSIAAGIIMHFSRFSEEIILWSSAEFNFIELDDSYATGSSIMPQKKNPDIAELVRGKAGRIYGNLIQLLTVMKGLPLAYNKDMQEDKEGVFDTVTTLSMVLELYPDMLSAMSIKKDNLLQAGERGYLNATELANHLVKNGLSFRRAHKISGEIVLYALDRQKELQELSADEWEKLLPAKTGVLCKKLPGLLTAENCVQRTASRGGTSPRSNSKIIKEEREWLNKERD